LAIFIPNKNLCGKLGKHLVGETALHVVALLCGQIGRVDGSRLQVVTEGDKL
jgi:hypothetical protein